MNAVWRPAGAWLGSNRVGQAPHITGRRDGAGLVVAHDVAELVDVIEPQDHHEGLRQLGVLGARAVARRLARD